MTVKENTSISTSAETSFVESSSATHPHLLLAPSSSSSSSQKQQEDDDEICNNTKTNSVITTPNTKVADTTTSSSSSQPTTTTIVGTTTVATAAVVLVVVVNVQPYEMCSYDECEFRVRTNEISIYEQPTTTTSNTTTSTTTTKIGSVRYGRPITKYDPCKVIAKYRRSVSTTATTAATTHRSISALYTTIQYLIHHIYIIPHHDNNNHHHHSNDHSNQDSSVMKTFSSSYRSKLEFMEDRIRAVQVDIVKQQVPSLSLSLPESTQPYQLQLQMIQYNITKYYILTLYIMSDGNDDTTTMTTTSDTTTTTTTKRPYSSYETIFALRALQTSIYTYMNCTSEKNDDPNNTNCHDPNEDSRTMKSMIMDDEMMAYFILIQFNQQLLNQQQQQQQQHYEYTTFWYNLTELYRKQTTSSSTTSSCGSNDTPLLQRPFTQYAFTVVLLYLHGQYRTCLQKIRFVSPPPTTFEYTTHDWNRFRILLTCCMAASIPYLRYQILVQINSSAMKNEPYDLFEVARLLSYHNHSSSTTRPSTDTTFNDDINTSSQWYPTSPPQWYLQECYEFCQPLQLSMISTIDERKDPLFLQHVRIVFKVNAIPPLDHCRIQSNATTAHPFRTRTTDIEQSIFVLRNNDGTTDPSTCCTTYTSPDGVIVPTPEWYYSNHMFF